MRDYLGIGKKLIIFELLYFFIILFLTKNCFDYEIEIPHNKIIATLVFIGGLIFYVCGLKELLKAKKEKKLLKKGLYSLVRHPLYSLWLFSFLPSFAIFFKKALFFTLPLFFYVVLRVFISEEEKELVKLFGREYEIYSQNVSRFFPNLHSLVRLIFPVEFSGWFDGELLILRDFYSNFYLFKKGDTYICIDSGISKERVEKEIERFGIVPDRVKAVFFTHSDLDHTGGHEVFENAKFFFGKGEKELIEKKIPRFFGIVYQKEFKSDYTLIEEGVIDICGIKVRAIETPGHTPGHMVYVVEDKYVFTGDLLRIKKGRVFPFYKIFSMNHGRLLDSFKKIEKIVLHLKLFTSHHGWIDDFIYKQTSDK